MTTRPIRRELRSLISQVVCFALLLQTSGLAAAAPLRDDRELLTLAEYEQERTAAAGAAEETSAVERLIERLTDQAASTPRTATAEPVTGAAAAVERWGAEPPRAPTALRTVAGAGVMTQAFDLTQVPLLAGPNLISLPTEPADPSPATVLAPIAGQYTAAFAYDACDPVDPWKLWDPADPAGSDLTAIDHTLGFWIDATAATSLPTPGAQPPTTQQQLCAGWNLIGYPLAQQRPVPAALASIAGKYLRVYAFELADATDPWEVYDVTVPAWANDAALMTSGRGYWVLVTEDVLLDYANEGAAPEVEIAAPAARAEIASLEDVVGSVRSSLLDGWTLSYRASGASNAADPFVPFASGNTPVEAGFLGTFDPTLLLNGMYDLKLEARDFQGQIVETVTPVAVDGGLKVGLFTLSFSDLQVPLSGLDIEIVRTYDSRDKKQRDFGVGWALEVLQGSYDNNVVPGEGWEIVSSQPPNPFPCVGGVETQAHLTTIRLSDQEVYRFRLEVFNTGPNLGGCFGRVRFAYVDGPAPGATLDILGNTDVLWSSGTDFLVDPITVAVYEPTDVRLTTRDGREFDLTLDQGVTAARDTNGNEILISPTSISHSSGESIVMNRDAQGRITSIVDPAGGTLAYQYDAAGDLVAFIDASGATATFTYDSNHGLVSLFDPLGRQAVRNDYDEQGRLIATTDANGNTVTFDRDLDARREVITDRLGAIRVLEYDARGNVVRQIDELGNQATRTYDADDNLLTDVDPLGRTTTQVWDAGGDLVSITDPAGNTTSLTYDGAGRLLTITDPRGGVATNVYDAAGNLISVTDPLGNSSVLTYDAAGNLLTETDALGGVTSFEYDARGNLTRRTDPLGHLTTFAYDGLGRRTRETRSRTLPGGATEELTTRFDYDANGRLVRTTRADGGTVEQAYDALGRATSRTDPLGRTTSFSYDAQGRLVRTDFPDGTVERAAYDDEGRLTSQVDRAGRTTTFTYDALGRLLTTTFPDGSSTATVYDAAGQPVTKTDERGHATAFTYGPNGRRATITDALGNTTALAYDAVGNLASTTDARGNTTQYTYDALNRRTQVTFADASTAQTGYDALGRRVSATDPAGRTTQFGYDSLGRLVSVTDALAQTTSFSYDEVGNRTTQTDANGNVTALAYDAMGRLTGRTLPGGAAESFTYHPDGTRATRTDFSGATTVYEYDANQRLTRRIYPDSSQVSFTYTPTGRRATVADVLGTKSFEYDQRDRLIAEIHPDGRRLDATFDAAGNRTALTATIGAAVLTTTYAYDAVNRLTQVIDPLGGAYLYSHDPVGNRSTLDFPNGVQTAASYDPLNRLVSLATQGAGGTALQSYDLTLDPSGLRTRVDEADGTARAYAYDALGRLTLDQVTAPGGALDYSQSFSYDPVGNRLALAEDDGSGTIDNTAYTYDTRDRLLTEGASITYGWDVNGNRISRSDPAATAYEWDFENRLARVVLPDGREIETAYDADGNRVRTRVTEPGGSTSTVDYLVDTGSSLSHVVAESDGAGAVSAYYARGDRLLAVVRPSSGDVRYLHLDALGSVRLLSDPAGAVIDRYSYTAYGVELEHVGTDSQPYGFAGEPLDREIGLSYNRARWLDPGVGRFLSLDPFAGRTDRPVTLHRYLYAFSDPVNVTDPSGRFGSVAQALTAVAVTGILAAIMVGSTYILQSLPGNTDQLPDTSRALVNTHSVEVRNPRASAQQVVTRMATFTGAELAGTRATLNPRPVAYVNQRIEFYLRVEGLSDTPKRFRLPFRVRVVNLEPELFSAVTLRGHPLAGYRFWRAFHSEGGNLVIQTGAVEHPFGPLNAFAAKYLGGDREAFALWTIFLQDAADFAGGQVVTDSEFHIPEGAWRPDLKGEFLGLAR